jgi:hypothetical protein
VDGAITWAIKEGKLWLTNGPASLCAEEVPAGLLTDGAGLQPPPEPIPANDLLPANLPTAWSEEIATAHDLADALSQKAGETLPWATVRAAIDGACQGRLLERTVDSGPWPCDYSGARLVKLRVPEKKPIKVPDPDHKPPKPPVGVRVAVAYLSKDEIQELAEVVGDLGIAAVGYDLKFKLQVEVGNESKTPPEDVVTKLNVKLGGVSKDLKLG